MAEIQARVEGNKWLITASFTVPEDDGAPTDPDTVVYTVRRLADADGSGDGTPVAYSYGDDEEVTRLELGVFELEIVPVAGRHVIHVQGTGEAYAAGEVTIAVTRSRALA